MEIEDIGTPEAHGDEARYKEMYEKLLIAVMDAQGAIMGMDCYLNYIRKQLMHAVDDCAKISSSLPGPNYWDLSDTNTRT